MALKRQHIFDDILGGGSSVFHSAVLTCFSFDPFFYCNFFRPQLNARGIINQLVLIDAGCLDEATESERFSVIPGASAFEGYTPLRIECPTGGVFHPKIGMYIGEKRVTAVIGSGNLTYSGMSFNDEAWCAFSVASADSPDAPLLASIWAYLKSVIARQHVGSAELQVGWMLENSALLQRLDAMGPSGATEPDSAGEMFTFAANTPSGAIFDRIVEAVGGNRVQSIRICAPFFDMQGTALKRLCDIFSPSRVDCLVLPEEGALPAKLDRDAYPAIRFYRLEMSDEKQNRMVHAKILQFNTNSGTVLAIGSANASVQALGGDGKYSNDEADVIMTSTTRRDYIKELGIRSGEEIQDLASFAVSAKADDEKKRSPKVGIRSCELLEDGYHLIIHKGLEDGTVIRFTDDFGRSWSSSGEGLSAGENIITGDPDRTARTVFLEKDGERVSNKCTVIIRCEVERKNPDKLMAPIVRLLENAQDSDAFEKLLQYVHIEEETKPKAGVHLSIGASSQPKEKSDQEITDEDFNNKVFRNRVSTLQQINDRILDHLAKLLTAPSEDWAQMEMPNDGGARQDLIDSGIPEDEPHDTTEKKGEKKDAAEREYTLMDEARGFFNKLIRHYDGLCWNLPGFKDDRGLFLIRRPFYLKEATDLSYSAVCIAVYEMCKIAKNGTQDDWEEMMDYFFTIVGEYLLIHRKVSDGDSLAVATKKARKHRNLFVYSLLLVSFWRDSGVRSTLLRLLTLNLFDSYRNDLNALEDAFREYTTVLNSGILPTEDMSVRMVADCYGSYLAFMKHQDRYRGVLTPMLSGAVVYRKSFGFIWLKDFKYGKDISSGSPLVRCRAFAPGFPDVDSSSSFAGPVRGVIANTALNESALIFEKD